MQDELARWRPLIDEAIADVLPREVDEEHLASFFGEPTYQYDTEAIQRGLSDPFWELVDRGGKRWRAVLFLVLIEAFGEDPMDYLPYATIPEILHTGTIIVDDVEDGAELRRGGPSLHRIYGQDVTLNAGNALYFIPLKLIQDSPTVVTPEEQLRAYEMLTYEFNRTHIGQGMDIHWHNTHDAEVTEAEYLEMSACKTGCLARITGRLAAIITGQSERVEEAIATYTERMSVSFQIIDDVLDVEHSLDRAGEFGKAFGNDIREGKITLLVIHAIEKATEDRANRLRSILATDDPSDDDILEAIEIIEKTESIPYSRRRAEELATEARQALDSIDLVPEPADKLGDFTTFMIERDI